MRNYYLEILELPPNATEKEIKTAYRRLSKKYHPDRNPQPEAEDKFIEITQAYDYLTSPQPTYAEPTTYREPEVSEYERWRQQARERVRQQKREEAAAKEALIRKLVGYFNFVAAAIFIFNILLATDYLLPKQRYEQRSLRIEKVFEGSRYHETYRYDDLHFEDFTLRINKGEFVMKESFERAEVIATRIFKKPLAAILTEGGQTNRYEPAYGIYQFFGLTIPVMFLLLGLYQFFVKVPDQQLSLAIAMFISLVIQLLAFFIV